MNRQFWQIASGAEGRNYSWLFLKHDLMFLGPGRYGPYKETTYTAVIDRGEYSRRKIRAIRTFAERVRPGDIILLREGFQVTALGVAAEEDDNNGYRHDQAFDDVYGWDLQHTRRVCWQPNVSRALKKIQTGTRGLFSARKNIPTFTRVNDPAICRPVEPLVSQCEMRPLKPRPDDIPPELRREELGQKLFSSGLANDAVDNVLRAIDRQQRLLAWYDAYGKLSTRPNEHEVVAHLILPLLIALGWPEQLLAVEWKNVDLAAFSETPTTADRCVLVCEAKNIGHGLQNVHQQALGYVRKQKLENCRKILLTQGARFYLYDRGGDEWRDEPVPVGYVNLQCIRENHLTPANTSAVKTLMALSPMGVLRYMGQLDD